MDKNFETVMKIEGEHPPLLDDEEMLCCSLISIYCYDEVKDVIKEACLHQRYNDVAWYKGKE